MSTAFGTYYYYHPENIPTNISPLQPSPFINQQQQQPSVASSSSIRGRKHKLTSDDSELDDLSSALKYSYPSAAKHIKKDLDDFSELLTITDKHSFSPLASPAKSNHDISREILDHDSDDEKPREKIPDFLIYEPSSHSIPNKCNQLVIYTPSLTLPLALPFLAQLPETKENNEKKDNNNNNGSSPIHSPDLMEID